MPRWAPAAAEVLFWWAGCVGVFLVSLSSVPGQELVLGLLIAVPAAVVAVVARRASGAAWRAKPAWAKPALLLPSAIISDTALVLLSVLPGRRSGGHFETITIAEGQGEGPLADGRRAMATWFTSATPGSIVASVDPKSGDALVHVLVDGGIGMQKRAAQ